MEFRRRIGIFLNFLGILLITLFVFSDIAHSPICGLITWGGGMMVLGTLLIWLNPKPESQDSGRFRVLRKKDRQEKKKAG